MDLLATVDPADLVFAGPVALGEAADGYAEVVAERLADFAGRAVLVQPERAAVQFVHGLALFWQAPDQTAAAITAVNEAARLDPSQPLYEAFANLLTP